MDMEKVAQLVKIARMSSNEDKSAARAKYRAGGQALRKKNKLKQRIRRRQGGAGLKAKVHRQVLILENKPIRIRREPLQHRIRDRG